MSYIVKPVAGWTSTTDMNLKGLIVRTHTEKYRIESDTFVAPFTAQSALNLNIYGLYAPDPFARLRSANTELDTGKQNPWVYYATVKYSSEAPEANQENLQQENPLDDDPEIDLDGETILYPMFKDRDDKLIINKAKQPLLGVEEERAIEVLTIVRNEATRDGDRDRLYRNSVNSDTWSGAIPGTLKVRSIKCSRQYRNGHRFWRYTYVVAYNPKGWQPKVLNAGTMQRMVDSLGPPITYKTVRCVDSNNEAVTDAVPLDDAGKQIPEASLPDAAVYITFNTLAALPIAALGLPSS